MNVSVDVMPIDAQGNEIGQSITSQSKQAPSPSADNAYATQSQKPAESHAQEQTQSQSAEQEAVTEPLSADRTY